MQDKNNKTISIGDDVIVPDPNETDLHNYSCQGSVEGFHGEYVLVRDGDGNFFDIEPKRLEIITS